MITQRICLRKADDWLLTIFYCPFKPQEIEEVLSALFSIGCVGQRYQRARSVLCSGAYNTGLTYSNPHKKETVIVIGRATSAEEFVNSFSHEKWHACCHIIDYFGMRLDTEVAAYLVGDISGEIFNNALHTLHKIATRLEK